MEKQVVIITGASSGIGAETARVLSEKGCRLVLVARRVERLQEVAEQCRILGGEVAIQQMDVSSKRNIEDLVNQTIEKWGRIDVLINNAGKGFHKGFVELTLDEIENGVHVNLIGAMHCARAVLPTLLKQGNGHIINVSSIAGLVATHRGSVYPATKFGLVGFSDALRRENLKTGVKVSAFCPGFTPSEISPLLKAHVDEKEKATWIPGLMSIRYVAEQLAWLMENPRRIYVIPKSWRFLVWLARHFPWLADLLIPFFAKKGKVHRESYKK